MKFLKKLLVFSLILSIALSVASCGSNNQKTVMEYEGSKLTSGMFSYGLSLNKTQVLYNLTYGVTDNAELWAYDAGNGKNIGEAVMDNYIENCKLILIADAELRKLGVKESEANESALDEMYNAEVSAQGSVAKLKVYLSEYGVTVDGMKVYHQLATKFFDLLDHYYGENGTKKISENEYRENLLETNVLVQHILYKTSKEDPDNANKEIAFTDEEVKALEEELEEKLRQIHVGEKEYEDFAEDNEDLNLDYFVSEDSNFVPEFLEAALEMKDGEMRIVKTTYGFHLMRKLSIKDEITEEKYAELISEENKNDSTRQTALSYRARLEQDSLYDSLKDKLDSVVIDKDEVAKFSVANAPVIK